MDTISTENLKKRMDAGEQLLLVDVREPEENAAFNIGGILMPLGQILSFQTGPIENKKQEEIICYCRSGKRSLQACMMLETMGFTNVKNLTGGMLDWQEKIKP